MDEGLEALRAAIDGVDTELLNLLNRRMALALEVGRLKQAKGLPLFHPGREEEIFERLGKANTGPLPGASLRSIYREILAASLLLQDTQQTAAEGRCACHAPAEPTRPAFSGRPRHDAPGNCLPFRERSEEPA